MSKTWSQVASTLLRAIMDGKKHLVVDEDHQIIQ